MFAYVAGLVASGGFSERFAAFLDGLAARVPLSASPELFRAAVHVGRRVLWLHTYGERFAHGQNVAEAVPPRPAEGSGPQLEVAIPDTVEGMPSAFSYDPETKTLQVGDGAIHPVAPEVWRYHVSGMPVVKKWLGYRIRNPKGKRSSPLDDQAASTWPPQLTDELLDLLNVLGLLVELEPR